MRVKMRCPTCQRVLMVRREEVGQTARCPWCKRQVPLTPGGEHRPAGPSAVLQAVPAAAEPRVRSGEGPKGAAEPRAAGDVPLARRPGPLYGTFYGFTEMPFGVTPDTRFFFPSSRHTEALASLIYAVTERKGFALLTGEIGSGKTTVARALLTNLDPGTQVAMVLNTHLTSKQLVEVICQEFGLSTRGRDRVQLHALINDHLVEQLAQDRNVVLIIDEAQNLTGRTLEEIRMISNLETEREKLIQIVLMGQPELKRKIETPQLEQLRQRITVRFHLTGLSYRDTVDYIAHRLRVAGNERGARFTRGALHEIARRSGGIPRMINIICDHALLTGFVRQTRRIDDAIVREVAMELAGEPVPERLMRPRGRLARTIQAAGEMLWRPFRGRAHA